jgi:hypothetical protein
MTEHEARTLSQMLFDARERVEMSIPAIERVTGKTDRHGRELVTQIDAYRRAKGWNPDGFGGETGAEQASPSS